MAYTIEIYQKNSQVEAIEIVCHEDWIDYLKKDDKKYDLSKVRWITQGGKNFPGICNQWNEISKGQIKYG